MYAAFDTETFYSKEYSVADLGPEAYVADPRFDCYLVSFRREDGVEWVGHPRDCPWDLLRGCEWVSHNAGFDMAVLRGLIANGLAPADIFPEHWHCSACLAIYLGYPRSLAQMVLAAYGVTVSKDIRDREIKGKHWEEMDEDLQRRVLAYGLDDARWSMRFFLEHIDEWPEAERRVARLNYDMGANGMYVDLPAVERDIQLLERALFEARVKIPWSNDFPPLSPKALALECRKVGIPPPVSLAKDSEECAEWEDQYGSTYPWVAAMRNYRRSNILLERLMTIRDRVKANGRMSYSLLYFGADRTGRMSGAGSLNMQNLNRAPVYYDDGYSISEKETDRFVDVRAKFIAPPGKKLLIADYAQIEARITPWLAGDLKTLELARRGVSVYEIHARNSMGWTGGKLKDANPSLYQLAKARVLGLGFGCGWRKFLVLARGMLKPAVFREIFHAPVSNGDTLRFTDYVEAVDKTRTILSAWRELPSDEDRASWVNSWLQVQDFRAKNPKIVGLWRSFDDALKRSVGGKYETIIPSGRALRYFNVHLDGKGQMRSQSRRGGPVKFVYGGLATENCISGRMEVLTDSRKWTSLDDLRDSDLVFDGIEFVRHEGLINRGLRPVMSCHGIVCTADHKFRVAGDRWIPAWRAQHMPVDSIYFGGKNPDNPLFDSEEKVFDILNCGPRHQFCVRSPGEPVALIAHNCVQATARDVLVHAMLALHDAGFNLVLDVHDEIVIEIDEGDDRAGPEVERIMTTPPPWARTLPLGVEYSIEDAYTK